VKVADHIIVGSGALASFAAFKSEDKGFSTLRIGSGRPFDRFLILHENAIRNFERNFGSTFGHPLQGLKVLDSKLHTYHKFDFRKYGSRLHSARYSKLLAFIESHDKAPHIEAEVSEIQADGTVLTTDGQKFMARKAVVNTVKGFAKPLFRFRHKKEFHMAFAPLDFDREWVWQINDRGSYAAVVPFENEFALVYSGDASPLYNLTGIQDKDMHFQSLQFESYYSPRYVQGKVFHCGEAIRRMHPHTGQGLNRGLDTIDAWFEGRKLGKEKTYDLALYIGGILLEKSWGSNRRLTRASYQLLDSRAGVKLINGTL